MPTFNLDIDDLAEIVEILEEGLLNRPEPDEFPNFDIQSAIEEAEAFSRAVEKLSDPETVLDGWDFKYLVEDMVEGYHQFWQHPFPTGLEKGQFLFSAAMEATMRAIRKQLKTIICDNEDGFYDPKPLVFVNPEREVNAFLTWYENEAKTSYSSHKKSNLSSLITAGIFGYWLGRWMQ